MTPETEARDVLIRRARNNRWVADLHRQKLNQIAAMLQCPSAEVVQTVAAIERESAELERWAETLEQRARLFGQVIRRYERVSVSQDDSETVLDLDMMPYEPSYPPSPPAPAAPPFADPYNGANAPYINRPARRGWWARLKRLLTRKD